MTLKLVLLGIGAAAVASAAVPVFLEITEITTDDEELSEDTALEAILDNIARSIRPKLNDTQKITFDREYKWWRKNKNRKQTEIYPNYFLDPSRNQAEWESKFNSVKKPHESEYKIVHYFSEEPNVHITKAWDPNPKATYDPRNTSLNIFCKHKKDDLSTNLLWKLCSFFQERPQTIRDETFTFNGPYSEKQMGDVFSFFLISTTGNASFWTKRQEEWQNLKPNNSSHFKYAANKQIKDLCKAAYSKNVDTESVAFQDEVLKYCSLKWNS